MRLPTFPENSMTYSPEKSDKNGVLLLFPSEAKLNNPENPYVYTDDKGDSLILHSQCVAVGFYRKNGFQEYGDVEDDQGCPHIWMKKKL